MQPLAQPPRKEDARFDDWMYRLWRRIAGTASIAWSVVDKTGSNLTDIQTRNHNDLQTIQGGTTAQYYHLTSAQATGLTDGNTTELHNHDHLYISVTNKTGVTITKGSVAYINGAQGSKATIALAKADSEITSDSTIGVVVADIANNLSGYLITVGHIGSLDTSAFVNGDIVWLSPTVAGTMTTTRPIPPNHAVRVGIIVNSHANQGQIEIHIDTGYELNELHDVLIATPANNDVLTYESATGLWKNKAVSSSSSGVNNVISTPTTIATDTSYIVASYLKIQSDLTINGNLMVTG